MPLVSLEVGEKTVLLEARALLAAAARHAAAEPETVSQAIQALAALREEVYEDLNQLQHEYLILRAAQWLLMNGVVPRDIQWQWNPRQTGDESEPDLAGDVTGKRIISAEVTTSKKPQGKIAERMALTLAKLSRMPGAQYYFICSNPMKQLAETKIAKAAWNIRAVCILHGEGLSTS